MSPKKAYSFTLNNYTEDEYTNLCNAFGSEAQYAIIGKEVGEQGTPHLQGYVMFKRSYRFQTVKDRYLPRCHIEESSGTPADNQRYCSKDGTYVEFGKLPTPKRCRDEIAQRFSECLATGHDGMEQFAAEHPGVFSFSGHNMLRNYQSLQRPIDRPEINVEWYYGQPGTGKSRKAHELMPNAYIKDPRTKWWNGYMGEKDVIIDDFGPGGIDINHLLRWFDRYKCIVETKGAMTPLFAINFIVTSNFEPSEIFSFCGELHKQLPALMRRIKLISF